MALRRKPSSVDEFINAGSTVPGSQESSSKETKVSPETPTLEINEKEQEIITVTLRIPSDLLEEANAAAKKCRPRRSRNSWILEAIIAKLESNGEKLT